MKGPGDISDILAGLKTKTINISEQPTNSIPSPAFQSNDSGFIPDNNSSTISISDLKEIQGDINIPKRTKRRQKSDKNTVSLDF